MEMYYRARPIRTTKCVALLSNSNGVDQNGYVLWVSLQLACYGVADPAAIGVAVERFASRLKSRPLEFRPSSRDDQTLRLEQQHLVSLY
jgi:hypothetical protein